jgi:ABC-type Na+ efflux pump permease subunit
VGGSGGWRRRCARRSSALNLASERDLSAYLFSFILPLTFVIMAVMGAFYPAVDCTAGEKERGTAETTLLLPAPRLGVQLGKVLAVGAAALGATVLNLLGLVLSAEPLLASVGRDLDVTIPWGTLALALPLCGAFLFTTSALLVALASFTETFKQGQALLGVVQLVFIVPALLAVLPGVTLTPGLALVPVLQTALAFKTVLAGDADALELGLVFLSQLLYAGAAVWISVRLASREALTQTGGSLRSALALWRTEGTPR